MFIPHPDFYLSQILDLGSRIATTTTKEDGERIFIATSLTKSKIVLFLNR
jgi:hypothetical protein